jgi:predicted XRE-type DNA-binding protein
MIKTYAEMRKIDVSPFVEKRDGNDYLNWARCKELLHQSGAEVVYFEPCVNVNGSSLFMSEQVFTDSKGNTNRCYEVRVHIVIDDLEFDAQYPLMNGSNPVKDNSLTQQRVWNAQTRAFVKGVAMRTGLGFDLWLKNMDDVDTEEDLSKHSLFAIKERFQQEYTRVIKNKKMSTSEIATACEMTEDEVKTVFTYFEQLNRFEQKLLKL